MNSTLAMSEMLNTDVLLALPATTNRRLVVHTRSSVADTRVVRTMLEARLSKDYNRIVNHLVKHLVPSTTNSNNERIQHEA